MDLIKLDIEGPETEVRNQIPVDSLRSVGKITIEFHDFLSLDELPRIIKSIERLRSNGFHFIKYSYNDYSDCLFVNEGSHRLNLLRYW